MIPLFKPSCDELEIENVTRVLRSGWWGLGPETEKFEGEFAKFTKTSHAIGVNSCTSALELAARTLSPSKTIAIVPSLTFVSTAQAMRHAGHAVMFADVDEANLIMDWDFVRQCLDQIGDSVRPLVVPVWYGGRVTSVPADIFDRAYVIEDCAHAAGSLQAGLEGDMAAWSFQAVKNLATGDGGMITTNAERHMRTLRRLRWCGIDRSTWDRDKGTKYGWDYDIPGDGEKAHMNDITAALGRAQLAQLQSRNFSRREIARRYNSCFADYDWIQTQKVHPGSSTHMYFIRVPAEMRDRFIDHMLSRGVSAGVHYKPLTHYRDLFGANPDSTPVAEREWQRLVTLPLYPSMNMAEINTVINTVGAFRP